MSSITTTPASKTPPGSVIPGLPVPPAPSTTIPDEYFQEFRDQNNKADSIGRTLVDRVKALTETQLFEHHCALFKFMNDNALTKVAFNILMNVIQVKSIEIVAATMSGKSVSSVELNAKADIVVLHNSFMKIANENSGKTIGLQGRIEINEDGKLVAIYDKRSALLFDSGEPPVLSVLFNPDELI